MSKRRHHNSPCDGSSLDNFGLSDRSTDTVDTNRTIQSSSDCTATGLQDPLPLVELFVLDLPYLSLIELVSECSVNLVPIGQQLFRLLVGNGETAAKLRPSSVELTKVIWVFIGPKLELLNVLVIKGDRVEDLGPKQANELIAWLEHMSISKL